MLNNFSENKLKSAIKNLSKEDRSILILYKKKGYAINKNTIDSIKRGDKVGYKIKARVRLTGQWKPDYRGQFAFNKMRYLNITMDSLAQYFNISRQTLAKYVRGEKINRNYKVSQEEINKTLDHLEFLASKHNIKPSTILERSIKNSILK